MDATTFRERLAADGFAEVLERDAEPHSSNELHEHPFDARLLVVDGELMLGSADGERRIGPGEMCELPRGERHRERYGAAGARLVIGRRY